MRNHYKIIGLSFLLVFALCAYNIPLLNAQDKKGDAEKKDNQPQPYDKVITAEAKTQMGLFAVHKVKEDYFWEISDTLLNRDILAITRMSKTATGSGYGGEEENRQVIRFEKAPNHKILLRVIIYINASPDSTQPISMAVENSNLGPLIASFDIKSYGQKSSVISVNDFLKGDNQAISLDALTKKSFNLTTLVADRSYIKSIKTYPINTEIRTVKTYNSNPPNPGAARNNNDPFPTVVLPAGANTGFVTFELNTSMILLPKIAARKRLFDNRVGFFANGYTLYEENSQKASLETFIVRWKLEPRAEDVEKMKRGELVEPKKPIVYYIDPATPMKWRPYLKQGVEDWQKAFEKAGFKNAIIAKEVPLNDSTFSLEDARYSVIRYFASDILNAYGPNVHDPRTGEILESHIGWYHNVMKLVYQWYFIQAAAVDPSARKPMFDDELMGQLVRFVAAHEVGHTLGLRHNFGSSSGTPVEKLRDKEYISKYGHTASIMDYARFNYVAQPEDGITDLMPHVGVYDMWAIEWGYKPIFNTANYKEDQKVLNQWILSHADDPMYWFGSEINSYDPRSQSEDLSNNAMKAGEYGIMNLKRILPNLPEWTKQEAQKYELLNEMYNQLFIQFRRYVGHVTKYIGGIYETPKTVEQAGAVYEPTPKQLQKDAMAFLSKNVFETPTWLLDQNILSKINPGKGVENIRQMQDALINNLFDYARMQRLIESSSTGDAYSIEDLFTDTRKSIFSELAAKKSIDVFRRNLQKGYVEKLIALLDPQTSGGPNNPGFSSPFFPASPASPVADMKKSDVMSQAYGTLMSLKDEMNSAKGALKDKASQYHLMDLIYRIEKALKN